MSAAASGVLLFVGNEERRAHHVVARFLSDGAATFADSNAPQRCTTEVVLIVRELKVCLRIPALVFIQKAAVLVNAIRMDDLAGIHLPLGIPKLLEFAECVNEFGAEHLPEHFRAALPVAMFAGERAAVGDDQVSGLFDELAIVCDTLRREEIEADAGVYAAHAEVSV